MSKVPFSQVLTQLQKHGRSQSAYEDNLIEEIRVLSQVLCEGKQIDGLSKGAVAGLAFLTRRLYETFNTTRGFDEMAERYAELELESFAADEDRVEQMKEWARREGVIIRSIPVDCLDGVKRYMFASHLDQTTRGGHVLKEGEFIDCIGRFPPPFRALLGKSR